MARRADLTEELGELRRRGLPVVVLWGRNDQIVTEDSFEAMCLALGSPHVVTVPGSHSWLIADPDAFGEVMTNVLDIVGLVGGTPNPPDAAGPPGARPTRSVPPVPVRPGRSPRLPVPTRSVPPVPVRGLGSALLGHHVDGPARALVGAEAAPLAEVVVERVALPDASLTTALSGHTPKQLSHPKQLPQERQRRASNSAFSSVSPTTTSSKVLWRRTRSSSGRRVRGRRRSTRC